MTLFEQKVMKHYRLCLAVLLILSLLFQLSCKKKGNPAMPDAPEPPTVPITPTSPVTNPNPTQKVRIPQSISTDNFKVDFQYATINQNRLTEIRQSNGTREMISYHDNGIPKEYKRYIKDELIYHVYYMSDPEGFVIKAIQYSVASGGKALTLIGNYQLTYGAQKEIVNIDWYDFQNMLTQRKQNTYDGNLQVADSKSTAAPATSQSFQYDERIGIFKHVPQAQLLSIEHQAFYMLNQKSNLKSIANENQSQKDLKFDMEYNLDGYPTIITQTDATKTQKIYKVTY